MTLKVGYTHITVSLGLSRLELNTQVFLEQIEVFTDLVAGNNDLSVVVHTQLTECTVDIVSKSPFSLPSSSPISLSVSLIDIVPSLELRPTFKILAELADADKVKYGKPRVSFEAYRYRMLSPKDCIDVQQVKKIEQIQASLF